MGGGTSTLTGVDGNQKISSKDGLFIVSWESRNLLSKIPSDLRPLINCHLAPIERVRFRPLIKLTESFRPSQELKASVDPFSKLHGVAIEPISGEIYVGESTNRERKAKIHVFRRFGSLIRSFPSGLSPDSTPDFIFGIDGNLILVDPQSNQVRILDPKSGETKFSFGSPGTLPGEFKFPSAVTLDNDGNTVICDTGNSRLQFFTPSGKWIRSIDTLNPPTGLAISPNGNLVLCSYRIGWPHSSLCVMIQDGRKTRETRCLNEKCMGEWFPEAVRTDANGEILVLKKEHRNYRVQIMNDEGELLTEFGTELSSLDPHPSSAPSREFMSLCITNDGCLVVVDGRKATIWTELA